MGGVRPRPWRGRPFELDLPIHPPGTAYLIASLWDGRDAAIGGLKVFWALLGAVVVLLVYVAALRSFGLVVAAVAATALRGVHRPARPLGIAGQRDAVPGAGHRDAVPVREHPGLAALDRLAGWAALHGLACLFRVEHALFYALFLGFLAVLWRRAGAEASQVLKGLAVSVFFFALPLVPWHAEAWSSIRRFNTEPMADDPSQRVVRRVAESLAWMPWDDAARAERDRLPAFARDAGSAFVAATVLHRGGGQVRGEDLRILDQAFGYRPRPLGRAPFVSLYGPLNFALANHPRSPGGFSRAALEDPPPLAVQPGRYPPGLVQGLPPPDLSFVYPPHVRLVNDGYALGMAMAPRPRTRGRRRPRLAEAAALLVGGRPRLHRLRCAPGTAAPAPRRGPRGARSRLA